MTNEPHIMLVEIDKETALLWLLECNTHNRKLVQSRVDKLASAIVRGEWRITGEAIKFSGDPFTQNLSEVTLLDGQHRLAAIAEQNAVSSVKTYVAINVEPEAQEVMDQGTSRNLSDVLALRGEKHARELAAAISLLRRIGEGKDYNTLHRANPTPGQATTILQAHPALRDSVEAAQNTYNRGVRVSKAVLAITHYQFSQIDYNDAAAFFDRLATGVGLEEGSPILALRRYIQRARDAGGQMDWVVLHAVIIKAWNAYRDGKSVKVLAFKRGGATPEQWPVPH